MCRSAFLKTLAALLAGTHTAGPLPVDGLPDAVIEPPRDPATARARVSPTAASGR
jgi:hypothetical protein